MNFALTIIFLVLLLCALVAVLFILIISQVVKNERIRKEMERRWLESAAEAKRRRH